MHVLDPLQYACQIIKSDYQFKYSQLFLYCCDMNQPVKYPKGRLHTLTHEVVVPRRLSGRHEKAEETIGQKHLHLLVVRRQVAFRIVASVLVLTTPLVATRRQLVRRQ